MSAAAIVPIDFDVSATERRVLDLDVEEAELRVEHRMIYVQIAALIERDRIVSVRLQELHLERVELLEDVADVRYLRRAIIGPQRGKWQGKKRR